VRWTFLVLACALFGAPACKKQQQASAGPAASGSAAAALAAKGPCGQYAAKVCEATGKDSPTCATINSATDLLPPDACTAAVKDIKFTLDKLAQQRKKCDDLVAKLCAGVGKDTESCQMVTTQTKQFPPERCEQMLPKVPQIIEELKKREAANKPLSAETQTMITAGTPPAFGPANASVTIVEFSDFQCPYCSRAAGATTQVKKKYGDKVRFIFRMFPLSFHEHAHLAAEAALAANAQGKFWEFHDLLFANQQKLDEAGLEEHAKKAGLDLKAFKAALDKHEFNSAVESDMKLGGIAAVQGTPTMFINGARVANPTDFASLSAEIDKALGGKTPG